MEIENKLKALGIELPNLSTPAANYIGYVRVGTLGNSNKPTTRRVTARSITWRS